MKDIEQMNRSKEMEFTIKSQGGETKLTFQDSPINPKLYILTITSGTEVPTVYNITKDDLKRLVKAS